MVAQATTPNSFDLKRLRDRLKPFRLHWYPRLRSTNDHAIALRNRGRLFAPAVVLTGRQIAGRGRGANTWWSRPGSLTVTFVLAAGDKVEPHQLPLVAGLAVRNAAAELTGQPDIALKWPNDVLYEGKKIAGLLCERVRGADLVGIGINVNTDLSRAPKSITDRIISLALIRRRPLDMTDTLAVVAGHLRLTLDRAAGRSFAPLLREYDQHHALIGREVCVTANPAEPPLCGKCEGLDSIGRLLLRSRGKLQHVISGQVQMR
jgi:BirA family biotin operon repressor/biotin-[acetyl-CoA-carboxylase] ligase